MASIPKHGSVWLGGFQFPPAARLLHSLHLWLVGLVRVAMPAKQMYEEVDEFGERELIPVLGVSHRFEMQEAGVALDNAMKNFSMVQYSA